MQDRDVYYGVTTFEELSQAIEEHAKDPDFYKGAAYGAGKSATEILALAYKAAGYLVEGDEGFRTYSSLLEDNIYTPIKKLMGIEDSKRAENGEIVGGAAVAAFFATKAIQSGATAVSKLKNPTVYKPAIAGGSSGDSALIFNAIDEVAEIAASSAAGTAALSSVAGSGGGGSGSNSKDKDPTWAPDPDKSIEKQLQGKGQLKDLKNSPNTQKGVNIKYLVTKTPRELEQMKQNGEITDNLRVESSKKK